MPVDKALTIISTANPFFNQKKAYKLKIIDFFMGGAITGVTTA
jgi:hypothetical protein